MRYGTPLLILLLSACAGGPRYGLGLGITPDGVGVYPSISGDVGGATVGISGAGGSLGTSVGGVGVGVGF
jgi:hypothetical protein